MGLGLSIGLGLSNADESGGAGGAAPFDHETWLATARVYWDPEDNDSINLTDTSVTSIDSKGTLDHKMKLVAGAGVLATVSGKQMLQTSSNARYDVRNAADSANINHDGVVARDNSCILYVVSLASFTSHVWNMDATAWAVCDFATNKPRAHYWDVGYKDATSAEDLPTSTLAVVGFHHDGENIWVTVNGVSGTPVACGTVGGTSAWSIIRLLNGNIAKIAAWNVATPTDFAAGVAALMTYYGIA